METPSTTEAKTNHHLYRQPPHPKTTPPTFHKQSLQARVDDLFRSANVTFHFTAPVEHAVAALHDHDLLALEAPAAAQQVAAVHSDGRVVALSSVGALDAQLGVALAERRRGLVKDEILRAWRFVLRVVRTKLEAVPGRKKV